MKSLELWIVITAAVFGLSLNVLATESAESWSDDNQHINPSGRLLAPQDVPNSEFLAVDPKLNNTAISDLETTHKL